MSSAELVDAAVKSRHPERVAEKPKYWDHNECCWVSYDAALEDIPEQLTADQVDAEEVTAVETPL